jgi:hypothetical protein
MSDLGIFPITKKWPAQHPERLQHPMYPRAKVLQHAAVLALLVTLMNSPLASAAPPTASKCKLIGADFFRAHRVYVARGQAKMYFTYLGGPVFQNIRQPAAPAPATASPAADTPGATAGAPTVPPDQSPPQAAPPPGDTPNPATPK